MKREELYYIPDDEMDEVMFAQNCRKKAGKIQTVLGIINLLTFTCTDVEKCAEIPYWMLLVGVVLIVNGVRMLVKFENINEKYDIRVR